jgi:hypothetical protein
MWQTRQVIIGRLTHERSAVPYGRMRRRMRFAIALVFGAGGGSCCAEPAVAATSQVTDAVALSDQSTAAIAARCPLTPTPQLQTGIEQRPDASPQRPGNGSNVNH